MTRVENEVFIGLLHENIYLVGREPTFGGCLGKKLLQAQVNEQIFG